MMDLPAAEFALGCQVDRLDHRPSPMLFAGKVVSHLSAHAMNLPGFLAALGLEDTVGLELFAAEFMVAFGIRLSAACDTAHRRPGAPVAHCYKASVR